MAEKKKRVLLPLWVRLESYDEALSVFRCSIVFCIILSVSYLFLALKSSGAGVTIREDYFFACIAGLFALVALQIYRGQWYRVVPLIAVLFIIEGGFKVFLDLHFGKVFGLMFVLAGVSVLKAWWYIRKHNIVQQSIEKSVQNEPELS